MDRITSGIAELDTVLKGGFPKGSTILVAGRPGTGKTILAHQMMFANATAESKVIYLTTLAEPQVKVMKFQQEFAFFEKDKFQKAAIYHDLGGILRTHGSKQALLMVDKLLKQYEPSVVIIDTIKTIAEIIPSLIELREFILDLSLRLAVWDCTALLLGEYSEADIEIRPESAIADGIIYLSGMEEKVRQKRFLRILKMRGTGFIGGENLFNITRAGIQLYPRLSPVVSEQGYQQYDGRISTGIRQLDAMMDGGIPQGTTTLLSGASGTGKTIAALHFVYVALEAGEPVVYVSFEENINQLIKNAKSLGFDLQSYVNAGKAHLLYISPIELDVDIDIYRIQKKVKETGASRLVIDSISSFEIGMPDKVEYTNNMWALTDYFKNQRISVLLTHELHDSDRVSKLTKHGISFIADNVILLCYQEEGLKLKRYLRVVKIRGSKHANTLEEIIINGDGISLKSR